MERQYKDSGIEWIGRIPKEWSKDKVNRIFHLIGSGTTPSSSDNDAYEGTLNWIQSGDINGGDLHEAKNKISHATLSKYSALSVYEAPFIIVAMYGASVGNISISHINGCVNQACCVLANSTVDFKYAFYAIKSAQRYLIYKAVGGGQPNISQYTLRQLWIPVPSPDEQQRIADYLDKKCGEIDGLISLQEQMIQTLTDYKQSVITEAVTKGLNPNAHLVPSGIEWIGDVPEGWKVCRIKDLFFLRTGTTPKNYEQGLDTDTLVNWFTPSDVSEMNCELHSSERHLSEDVIRQEGIELNPIGSLVFVGIGSAGKVGYANVEGYSNQQITVLVPKTDFSKYSYYYMIADRKRIRDNAFFTTLPIINNSYLSGVKTLLPPLTEQRAIASFLDTKCSEIDSLIALKRQKIDMLKDYKKSVIYEAVTGKVTIEQDNETTI